MDVNFVFIAFLGVVCILLTLATAKPEFSFPDYMSAVQRSIPHYPSRLSYRNDDDPTPEGKHLHKTKKLKRKIRRLCLLTGGRSARSVPTEGKFFFPTIVQQTGVNVDVGAENIDYDDATAPVSGAVASAGAGAGAAGLKCVDLLNAGFFNDLHPFPQVFGGGSSGGANDNDDDDDDSESKFYHKNLNRLIIRPLYRSVRKFYRLLKRR